MVFVPGKDGEKMSKSKGNTIDIFQTDKKLRKSIMQIETDSTPLEAPKDPDTCNVFKLYEIIASPEETQELRQKYEAGNFGYGHAKQALFELIKSRFDPVREQYQKLMNDRQKIDDALEIGAEKAKLVADNVLGRLREKLGYKR